MDADNPLLHRISRVVESSLRKYFGYESDWQPRIHLRRFENSVSLIFESHPESGIPSYKIDIVEETRLNAR